MAMWWPGISSDPDGKSVVTNPPTPKPRSRSPLESRIRSSRRSTAGRWFDALRARSRRRAGVLQGQPESSLAVKKGSRVIVGLSVEVAVGDQCVLHLPVRADQAHGGRPSAG